MEFVYFIRKDLVQHHVREEFTCGTRKKIAYPYQRWVVGHVDAHVHLYTLTALNQIWCFLIFTKQSGIRDMSHWQELRPFTLSFIPHFTANRLPPNSEISSIKRVYFVISTTITKHPNRKIIRCITLWTMGSGRISLLGEMKPTQDAN
jgi:hypothetical protein